MRSCTRRPTGLSAKAVTTAVSRPKQRLRPRATLYSPPPSQAWKVRVVVTRPSPGSRRNITSPSATRSQRQRSFGFTVRPMFSRTSRARDNTRSALGSGLDLHVAGRLGRELPVGRAEADLGLDLEHHARHGLHDLGVQVQAIEPGADLGGGHANDVVLASRRGLD